MIKIQITKQNIVNNKIDFVILRKRSIFFFLPEANLFLWSLTLEQPGATLCSHDRSGMAVKRINIIV